MIDNPLLAVKALGQHVWLDNLSHELIHSGTLQRLITECGIDGVTSNPAIFLKAISGSTHYREMLEHIHPSSIAAEARYEALVIPDIQAACDILLPAYVSSSGDTGFVSLEVSPVLANDVDGTVTAAHRLKRMVSRDNLLIKVPATPAGVHAAEQLTATGVPVNVTLIFSVEQYESVAQAYLRGAQGWLNRGGMAGKLRSVASVFLSRVDTLVDRRLEAIGTTPARVLMGRTGVTIAKLCYRHFQEVFHGPDFAPLAQAGVPAQTLLWASTGNKNPEYSDLLYVEPLIGPQTITTLPDATLTAFRDHGRAEVTLTRGLDAADLHIAALTAIGIDLSEVGDSLRADGVRQFRDAYAHLLAELDQCIGSRGHR